jgi:hypothetical protein
VVHDDVFGADGRPVCAGRRSYPSSGDLSIVGDRSDVGALDLVIVVGRDRPSQLQFDLLGATRTLVLDAELGVPGYPKSFACDLDAERPARLERVGEPSQLGDEVGDGCNGFDVTFGHGTILAERRPDVTR